MVSRDTDRNYPYANEHLRKTILSEVIVKVVFFHCCCGNPEIDKKIKINGKILVGRNRVIFRCFCFLFSSFFDSFFCRVEKTNNSPFKVRTRKNFATGDCVGAYRSDEDFRQNECLQ